ncbi:MAG: hypothetical protein FJX59_08955 [Alphaproteobacteria bacterium]|nr:hypothetical protein [Alphaproteobacteria bacterium]
MKNFGALVGLIFAVVAGTNATAAPVLLYSNNFDGPAFVNPILGPGSFGPVGNVPWIGPALGPVGNQFSGNVGFLPPDSGSATSTLTLTGLPTHTSISIDFLAVITNTWDGLFGTCCGPDSFRLRVRAFPD